MKKSLLILTAALTFGNMAAAQTSATASAPQVPALTDVPAGHWAKDAIDKLIGRGILLGYPDGTFRGTQNLTRYEAAVIIARLLEQVQSGQTVINDDETVTALQNAVQELAADLAALGVRVTALEENAVSKEDFARLEERVNALGEVPDAPAGDPEAVANLQAQIDALTVRADEYDALRADIDDNASGITALNDLTVLLNQDILDLQDRVSAVEAAQADFVTRADFDALNTALIARIDGVNTTLGNRITAVDNRVTAVDARVTGVDTRVTKLETAPKFGVVGTINAQYGRLALIQGTTDFDISRLTNGTFANGFFDAGDGGDPRYTDTSKNFTGTGLRFGVRATQLTTANGAVVVNNAAINFRSADAWDISKGNPNIFVYDASVDGKIGGQKFDVKYHASLADFKFQNYLFNNSTANGTRRGIVANIATTLPGNPNLTVVAGSTNSAYMTGGAPEDKYFGVRAAYAPAGLGKFGVSFGQVFGFRTALGTDFDMNVGPVGLKGEGVFSATTGAVNGVALGNLGNLVNQSAAAGYLEARADLGMVKFGANARAISPAFTVTTTTPAANNAGMQDTKSGMPYAADQVGYGAALGTNLGPVALGAYADSYTNWYGKDAKTGFGVKAGGKLGALELVGFYNNLTVAGGANSGTSDFISSDYDNNNNAAGMDIANVPFAMTTSFGAQVSHDGKAANALVKDLNFTVGDAYFPTERANSIYAYGDYTANLGGFTLSPLLRYRMVTDSDTAANNYNLIKYGVKLATPELTSVPFRPSLYANFVGVNDSKQSSELLAQAGISFSDFIASGVSAKLGYSYYQGINITPTVTANSAYASASNNPSFKSSSDVIWSPNGNGSAQIDGLYTQIGWNGLSAGYGLFHYNDLKDASKNSVAQGFKVSYNFAF